MRRRTGRFFAVIIFLGGLGIFLYPHIFQRVQEEKGRQAIRNLEQTIAIEKEELEDKEIQEAGTDPFPFEELYQDLQQYNRQIYEEGQRDLKDPFSYETASFDLTSYGFSENVIGTLWIPRLELELPIYLGANADTMAVGAGLLGQTSMPLGGADTNTVIAAHRGWRGLPMFRNIQAIQIGDKIQITTPWETLIYRVCELKIVPKDDTEVIYIQERRDLITLLTCHPYTQNEQRYVVIAERTEEAPAERAEDLREAAETKSTQPQEIEVVTRSGSVTEKIYPEELRPLANEGLEESGAEYSCRRIWLETWAPYIGIGVVILIAGILWGIGRRRIG